ASRMPMAEPAACVPDQAPPGETVNVVAPSAGAATNATAATANTGMASRGVLCFMIPPQRSETGPRDGPRDQRPGLPAKASPERGQGGRRAGNGADAALKRHGGGPGASSC